jgi:hypothetical protein
MTNPNPEPRVFIPHPVMTNSTEGVRWKFNIERVLRDYGPYVCVLGDSKIMLTYEVALSEIRKAFRRHMFDPRVDYFLAAGDMTVYGSMMAISTIDYGGTPKQLRHNKLHDDYDILPTLMLEMEEV